MRRTVVLTVGLSVAALMTGIATATTVAQEPRSVEVGLERVGTVEAVQRILGYGRSELRYPGADYVKVHFDRIDGYATVADKSGKEVHRYGPSEDRWAMSVTGDTAVVTVHSALPNAVTVDKVARGFTPAERASQEKREESVCGGDDKKDAICYKSSDPVAYKRSKAVARLLIDGTELCTGWRIGRGNRMLTNHHCFTSSEQAYNTEVWFDYQCAECGGFEVFQPTKVWGDKVIATESTLDFTLFTVDDFAAVQKFGYLDVDLSRPRSGQEVYIPQHPAGNPGVIAMGSDKDRARTCRIADPLYDGYAKDADVSYQCDTEGGSSGSPVISRGSDKVIAMHHWGGCPNSGVRIDLIYQKIKSRL